jgi:hypothetical protein
MSSSPTPAKVAAQIRSLRVERPDQFTITGRLKNESLEPVAARIAEGLMRDFTEADLLSALSKFKRQHPQHFNTNQEIAANLRKAWRGTQNPPKTDGATRDTLAQMSAGERLHFANSGELPRGMEEAANGN